MAEIVVFLLAAVGVAVAAVGRTKRRGGALDVAGTSTLLVAIAAFAVVVVGPIDGLADRWLWWHMVQHLALLAIVAPLLAVAHQPELGTLARRARRPLDRAVPGWDDLPAAAVVALAVLFVWHVPALYDSAVEHPPLHAAEHLTIVASAAWLWRRLREPHHGGVGVVWLFLITLPMTVLGVAMTLARTSWYAAYRHASAASALRDQQLAGVVMWAFGGIAAVVAAVALFASWLARAEIGGVA
jgi:putative membrane protein